MISAVQSTPAWGMENPMAGSAAQRHKEMFDHLDVDGDGKITAAELEAGKPANGKGPDAATTMKQVDTDGDGAISEAENETFLSKMDRQRPPMGPPPSGNAGGVSLKVRHAEIFDSLDTNKDGKVSAEELAAAKKSDGKGFDVSRILELSDTDGDGSISEDENDVFLTKLEEFTRSMMRGVSAYDGKGRQQGGGTGGVVDATM